MQEGKENALQILYNPDGSVNGFVDVNGVLQWDVTNLGVNEGGNDVVELTGGGYLVFCSGTRSGC